MDAFSARHFTVQTELGTELGTELTYLTKGFGGNLEGCFNRAEAVKA